MGHATEHSKPGCAKLAIKDSPNRKSSKMKFANLPRNGAIPGRCALAGMFPPVLYIRLGSTPFSASGPFAMNAGMPSSTRLRETDDLPIPSIFAAC